MAKTETFKAFTEKWKDYVQNPDKTISEEDWNQFFAQTNPVAGIDRGALMDSYKNSKGIEIKAKERQTIKDCWREISKIFCELYKEKDKAKQKEILKNIKEDIKEKIKKNGSERKPEVAINRILVTLYPEELLTIPSKDNVEKLAGLLNKSVDGKDWIDLCYEIKSDLEKRYPNQMHWGAYLQLVQENNLTKNYNLILTGAPGTGKTFLARQMAANMIGCSVKDLEKNDQFGFVQFHPSYDYTDFVEGLRPDPQNTNSFIRQDGIFKDFCKRAAIAEQDDKDKPKDQKRKYVFVIDEINRGEISKIFGELFFSIDPGYREEKDRIPVKTQYQNLINDGIFKDGFYVPSNVYVIGTMNDIDRSVESMDFAFRRRFAFYEVKATDTQYSILKDCGDLMDEAIIRMNNLNKAIEKIDVLSPAYHIGAAYFKKINLYRKEKKSWESLWNNHLKGLLYEYLRGLPYKEIDKKLKELEKAYNKKEEETNDSDISEE